MSQLTQLSLTQLTIAIDNVIKVLNYLLDYYYYDFDEIILSELDLYHIYQVIIAIRIAEKMKAKRAMDSITLINVSIVIYVSYYVIDDSNISLSHIGKVLYNNSKMLGFLFEKQCIHWCLEISYDLLFLRCNQ